ncbi:SusC/RagA family TonB-linked outer membrane protein [Marinilabilia rubra]|uniref:TonB-dependent receptor n=1 Tax=Marinilabilia rubra TaxID=2162893 RepID=A0A2U2BBB0_9BACT|nr:SusC/RagA family TonB-linked outer membrane protein [Marinilabilia rubra]PWE00323.1 TonB-dependent receptor [Marinilabilia rubra]
MKRKIYIKYIALFLMTCLFGQYALAQSKVYKGRIISSNGNYIKDAEVTLVGTDNKVRANEKGEFSLEAEGEALIQIDAGLVSRVFKLEDNKDYTLSAYAENIDMGLGYNKKPAGITAAVSTVNAGALNKMSVVNPENALYGQLAGLTVLQNDGTPWSRRPDLMVRGIGTLNNNSVLVLVDGIERPMSSLIIDDIESISVLKDAGALAIYGQRGANGAIIVTTKRGEYDSFKVDATYQYGLNTAFRTPEFLDAYQYAAAVNEASAMDGNPFVYSQWDLQDFKNGTNPLFSPNVDWEDEAMNDFGISTNFNTSFKGGRENVRYFSSINYQTEKGLFNHTDLDSRYDSQLKYTRFNVRANIDADITSTTLLAVNLSASMGDRKYPGGINGIMKAIYNTPSAAYPVRSLNDYWGGTEYYDNNPVAKISSTGYRQDFQRELLGDMTIKQDLSKMLDGLSAEVTAAFDNSAVFQEGRTKTYEYESVNVLRDEQTGAITDTIANLYGQESPLTDIDGNHNAITQWRHATFRAKANYDKSWGDNHLFASMMYSQDKMVDNGQYNTILHQNIAGAVQYAYKEKYFADVNVAYSGSSTLPVSGRFGLFPSLSGAWIVSREDFMNNSSAINLLKLRASWGMTGNDLMSPNLYDQKFSNGGKYFYTDNFSGLRGYQQGRLASTGLTYETATMTNVGLDMRFFNKLDLTVDAFYEKRTDILVDSEGTVSNVVGVKTAFVNSGEVENKGIEADLLWKDNIGSLNYYLGGNFSFVQNKVLNRNEAYRPHDYMKRTGQAVGQMYGLEAVGFFEDENDIVNSPAQLFSDVRPGDIKYKDQNDDGVINDFDEVAIGHSSLYPEIYYSAKLGFEIKGFGVDALLQGMANQTIYLNTSSVFWPLRNNTNISDFSADRWTPQTKNTATLPRLSLDDNANNYQKNTIWLADGDYLKLRSLDLYYNLPEKLVKSVKLANARVFVRGMNLFSIDKIEVVDPEAIDISYPTLASYHLGVNIGF